MGWIKKNHEDIIIDIELPEKIWIILGYGLILSCVLINTWTLGKLFSPDGTIDWLRHKILIWSYNIFSVGCGITFLKYRHIFLQIKTKWLTTLKEYIISSILIFISVGIALFIGLTAFDYYSKYRTAQLLFKDFEESSNTKKTIREMDLYPYSGWHIQSYFHHNGQMPWENDKNMICDVKSGQMGFFIDFDLREPPTKKKNEFRIILIGGSGAQGFGAQSNEKMLYKVLEKKLSQYFDGKDIIIKIINLAMAGSVTYQNYIALNRWGHVLKPDLILTYSGVNDVGVPIAHKELDTYFQFNELNALSIAARGSEFPPKMVWLRDLFPNIMTKTNIGYALKVTLFYNYFIERAKRTYRMNCNITYDYSDNRKILEQTAIPQYIHSLKSIKRDFLGIPIMVAWQAMSPNENSWLTRTYSLDEGFYNNIFEQVKDDMNNYINNKWYFINIHKMFENNPQPYIAVHLGNAGHEAVADILVPEIIKIIYETNNQN